MGKVSQKRPNEVWRDPPDKYILYTEDGKLISAIRGWDASHDGRINEMATYHYGATNHVYFAVQFRFNNSMLDRVLREAGLPERKKRELSDKELTQRQSALLKVGAKQKSKKVAGCVENTM